MSGIKQVVQQLRSRRMGTERQIEKLNLAINALTSVGGGSTLIRRKPIFSKAARARIAAAQRKRWAKIKALKKT